MNKNALANPSKVKVTTNTGKLPNNFGSAANQGGGGYVRKLTKAEQRNVERIQNYRHL